MAWCMGDIMEDEGVIMVAPLAVVMRDGMGDMIGVIRLLVDMTLGDTIPQDCGTMWPESGDR